MWQPLMDAAVQTLLKKGLLEQVVGMHTFQEAGREGEREECILVRVPEEVSNRIIFNAEKGRT